MCEDGGFDREAILERLKRIQALLQSARERVQALRPAWGAHLAGEAMSRIRECLDEIEQQLSIAGREDIHDQR